MTFLVGWWRSMGGWRWWNLLPIAVALLISTRYEAAPLGWVDRGERALGAVDVRLETRGVLRAGETLSVRVSLPEPDDFRIGFAGEEPRRVSASALDDGREVRVELPVPPASSEIATIRLLDGRHEAQWRIGRLIL